MKYYTDTQKADILYALQNNDLAINAVRQLYGDIAYTPNQFKTHLTEFRRDCIRLGWAKIYRAKYHAGRKARK